LFGRAKSQWYLAGLPVCADHSASIPCGLTRAGLPIGLQIVGAIGADALVLRASRAFEQAQPFGALEEPRVR
jgi:aspartyl-tRNA(Asn)/glutamyl-tRNA(Gln) amidotransferase subunit A